MDDPGVTFTSALRAPWPSRAAVERRRECKMPAKLMIQECMKQVRSYTMESLKEKKQKKINFQKHGSLLLEELIASSGDPSSYRQLQHEQRNLCCLGCCLEFSGPVLVCEYPEKGALTGKYAGEGIKPLAWNMRLKIAREIADAVTYLHTQFPRIIIHRDLKLNNIFLDENWTAKLTSFSLSIPIPEGESGVNDIVCGITGHVEPEYMATGFVTENVDVYNLGSMMLCLLTGKSWCNHNSYEDDSYKLLPDYVEECLRQGMFTKLIDRSMGDNVPDHSKICWLKTRRRQASHDRYMDCLINKSKKKKLSEANQRLRSFQENGKILLQDLIELCNGKSNPIKTFSANQIIQATDNFHESNHMFRFEFIYREYNYVTSGVVTENTDVFSFGVLLQNLLIGKREVVDRCKGDENRVCKFVEEGRVVEILDPQMLESMGDDETGEQERRQMEAVLMLSLRCTGHKGDVPKMMEVAKELKRIERWT
ncbi:hypothetical protein HID58_082480 [Brassica napus]|uniref:Protein kinase domain-containing protein n=1 Tax=Brassica napus TaxID=3708 RepID=A0ABQ7YAQ5_BRANA|nr:hypothetical protein HID58_082480 [Brassica napus]